MQHDLLVGCRAIELNDATIERERPVIADPVRKAPDQCAVNATPLVRREVVVAEHHVGPGSLPVRHLQGDDDATEVADAGNQAATAGEGVDGNLLTRSRGSPVITSNAAALLSRRRDAQPDQDDDQRTQMAHATLRAEPPYRVPVAGVSDVA